jgi:predicted transcriptional regulator YdeE
MDYFFGYVTNDPAPAEGFESITLSGGNYAVFHLPYGSDTFENEELALRIQALWQYIFEEWLYSKSENIFDDTRLCFEKYGIDMAEIYIPVSL